MCGKLLRFAVLVLCILSVVGCTQTEKTQNADSSQNIKTDAQESGTSNKAEKGISVFGGSYKNPFAETDLQLESQNSEKAYLENGFNFKEDNAYFPLSEVKEADRQTEKFKAAPKLGSTDYYNDDLPIYILNVLDFGAVPDGHTDCTLKIQKALNQAGAFGGGAVYIPAGTYCIKGYLLIPEYVTLRGDFCPPDENKKTNGTVLLAYHGKNDKKAKPFITLGMSATVQNLTVYYPEQKTDDISSYPPTVSAAHSNIKYGADSQSIKNMWFVNSYYIFDVETAKYTGLHWMKNIYGTPLNTGFAVKMCKDVGRIEKIHFSPQYWIKAQEKGIAQKVSEAENQKMFDYVYSNSVGIKIYSSDWEYIYNYSANGLNTALQFPEKEDHCSNIQLSHSAFIGCKYGIDVFVMNRMGSSFSDSIFVCANDEKSCALKTESTSRNPIMFNNCSFKTLKGNAVYLEGGEITQLVNCKFDSENDNSRYVIENINASLAVVQCTFENESKHILCHEKAKGMQILGCSFKSGADIKNNKPLGYKSTVNNEKLNLPVTSGIPHKYIKNEPLPKSKNIYYLLSYGAKFDKDCTQALKAALKDAAKEGGTVYIPGGKFYLSESITVPCGVELRGIKTANHSPKDLRGTVLMANPDIKSRDALIKLEPFSGISGFSVYYPEQKAHGGRYVEYPFTVQGLGNNVYVKNICLINSYKGIDFETFPSENHYLKSVNGCPLKTGITVGKNSGNGWIENCHFNPHYYRHTNANVNGDGSGDVLTEFLLENLEEFVLRDNYSEHMLNNFSYGSNKGIKLESGGKGGTNGIIIGQGEDNSCNALYVSDCDNVEMLNSTLCVIDRNKDIKYINICDTNKGKISVYNTVFMGQYQQAHKSVHIKSGDVIIQQGHILSGSADNGFTAENSNIDISAYILPVTKQHFILDRTLKDVNIKANFGIINDTKLPADNIMSISGAEERFNIKENRMK